MMVMSYDGLAFLMSSPQYRPAGPPPRMTILDFGFWILDFGGMGYWLLLIAYYLPGGRGKRRPYGLVFRTGQPQGVPLRVSLRTFQPATFQLPPRAVQAGRYRVSWGRGLARRSLLLRSRV